MDTNHRKYVLAAAAMAMAPATLLATAGPASATVHEIVGQWCSDQGELAPPGITGGSHADNVARPLAASGFLGEPVPFRDGILIPFNYDNPNSKVVGTGVFIDVDPSATAVYIELIEPDPDFPAFQHCPRLVTG